MDTNEQNDKKTPKQQMTSFGVLIVVVCFFLSLFAGAGGAFAVINIYPAITGTPKNEAEEFTEGEMHEIPLTEPKGETPNSPSETEKVNTSADPSKDISSENASLPAASEKTKGEVYADAVDSIVGIKAAYERNIPTFFGRYTTQSVTSTGSGFFVTDSGYIVTNYHVIKNATDITVSTFDGSTYKASVRGYEEANDIAVIKIDGSFKSAVTGSSSLLSVGDDILVIGNPLGNLSYTFTDGVVSYLNRLITGDTGTTINMFQTNAAINEGNSGGPVYNMNGEVVGIASAKYASSNIEGLGFFIPIDDVLKMINDIISTGYVTGKPVLGVSLQTISASDAARYGISAGCYVVAVGENTAAFNAGILPADVITAIDGEAVYSVSDMSFILTKRSAGDTVNVRVSRDGTDMIFSITLGEYFPGEARTSYSNVYDF
ncbi:MAG: serine protease [Oscillospiraceae bacterium]|nr:serine protease [Oscillospiraceae bacterium]